jgi:2-polyprenyl-6-hydroxyphenyl methylase/3-demethylubiquinone-9 3-methyltransferase
LSPDSPALWRNAYYYDEMEIYGIPHIRGYSYAYQARSAAALRMIRQVAAARARILDVAGAQGNFSLMLAEEGYRVTWNDLRADLIEYIKLKYERGDIDYVAGNVFDIAFEEPFDVVLATEVIEHVAHPDEFLRSLASLVKSGGYIVMTTPNGHYFKNRLPRFSDCPDPSMFDSKQFGPNSEDHIFLLHQDEIYTLASSASLEVKQIRVFTNPLTNGHLKTERLLHYLPSRAIRTLERFTQSLPMPLAKKIHTSMAVLFCKPLET